jgi:hypothetical protein
VYQPYLGTFAAKKVPMSDPRQKEFLLGGEANPNGLLGDLM